MQPQPARWTRLLVTLGNVHRRGLAFLLSLLGPRAAYAFMAWGGAAIYRLLEPLRLRGEGQLRAALGAELSAAQIAAIAAESFVHRTLNLADLMLARRWLTRRSAARRGAIIPAALLDPLRATLARRQPVILVTAYYGAYDLLPVILGLNDIPATVIYKPHRNAGFDEFRRQVRASTGCRLVPLEHAAARLAAVLDAGGAVALVADHHVEGRGLDATFFGRPTRVHRSVALLALHYRAEIVVAGIRRLGRRFHFEVVHEDTIRPADWEAAAGPPADPAVVAAPADGGAGPLDPQAYITQRYLAALERLIRRDPSQYLWLYARWGEQHARDAMAPPGG